MPVIAKTLLLSGTYDSKAFAREEMEKIMGADNINKKQQLKQLYNKMAFEQDTNFIHSFFDEAKDNRNKKMKESIDESQASNNKSIDNMWSEIKKDMLTKQEN